jgi:hypothetical protein
MSTDNAFKTVTMAKVYEGQGHWEKATEIYRYLLDQDPEREDVRDALDKLQSRVIPESEVLPDRVGALLVRWLDLTIRYGQLKGLEGCRSRFKALRRVSAYAQASLSGQDSGDSLKQDKTD